MHFREKFLTSNTAKLAKIAIPSCEIYMRGIKNQPLDSSNLIEEGETPLYLFPYEDAQTIGVDFVPDPTKKYHLIVPDGTWSQAQKIKKRHPDLGAVQNVTLPMGKPSEYFLRIASRPGALCTFEAISRAIGLLDGPELEAKLIESFDLMVSQSLDGRGQQKGWSGQKQVRLLKDKERSL